MQMEPARGGAQAARLDNFVKLPEEIPIDPANEAFGFRVLEFLGTLRAAYGFHPHNLNSRDASVKIRLRLH
jgi:hypothetical protein